MTVGTTKAPTDTAAAPADGWTDLSEVDRARAAFVAKRHGHRGPKPRHRGRRRLFGTGT